MKQFFRLRSTQFGLKIDPEINNHLKRYTRNLDSIVRKEQTVAKMINTDHILAGILSKGNISDTKDSILYYEKVRKYVYQIAQAIGLTSSTGKGRVFDDEFFPGKNVILLDTEPLSPKELINIGKDRWKKLQPVKVLRMPLTWHPLNIPRDGKGVEAYGDYAVISINISMLMFQWHQWGLYQATLPQDAQENEYVFIHKYPLVNMIYSMQNAFMINVLNGVPYEEIEGYKNALYVTDQVKPLMKLINEFNEEKFSTATRYQDLLTTSYSILNKRLSDDIHSVSDLESTPNYWAIFASYERYLTFLGKSLETDKNSRQSELRLKFKGIYRLWKNKGKFNFCPDPQLKLQLKLDMELLKDLYNL